MPLKRWNRYLLKPIEDIELKNFTKKYLLYKKEKVNSSKNFRKNSDKIYLVEMDDFLYKKADFRWDCYTLQKITLFMQKKIGDLEEILKR